MTTSNSTDLQLQQDVSREITAARVFLVRDAETYSQAGTLLQRIKTLRGRLSNAFDDLIAEAHKHHKALVARKRQYEEPLAQAESLIKSKATLWFADQERKRREEEQRLQVESRRRQEAEFAAAQAKVRAEEERRLAEAENLEQRGFTELAEHVIESMPPLEVPSIPVDVKVSVASYVPKVDGLGMRETWSARVVDLKALARAVADGKQPESMILPNTTVLNAMARSLKRELRVPGVEAVSSTSAAVSAAKE